MDFPHEEPGFCYTELGHALGRKFSPTACIQASFTLPILSLVIKEIILADLPEDLPGGYRPGFLKIKTGSRLGTVHTSEHRSLE